MTLSPVMPVVMVMMFGGHAYGRDRRQQQKEESIRIRSQRKVKKAVDQ